MATLTERENIYRMYRGEMPAFLPQGGFRDFKCSRFVDVKKPGYHVDEFGVEYIGKEGVFGGTPLPMPGKFLLHDIRRWRDVIKAPDLSDVDWAIIKLLYNPKIQCGMDAAACERVIRELYY